MSNPSDIHLAELERLANNTNSYDSLVANQEPSGDEITRWMNLFYYTHQEAIHLIKRQRNDFDRARISDDHWALVCEKREASGHSRESYEHELQLSDIFLSQAVTVPSQYSAFLQPGTGTAMPMIRIGGLLRDARVVQEVAGLDAVPEIVEIVSEEGVPAKLCAVSVEAKGKIKEWLDQQRITGATMSDTPSGPRSLGGPSKQALLPTNPLQAFAFDDGAMREVDAMLPQRRNAP